MAEERPETILDDARVTVVVLFGPVVPIDQKTVMETDDIFRLAWIPDRDWRLGVPHLCEISDSGFVLT